MGLLPAGLSATGSVRLQGQNLLSLPDAALCRLRGRRMAMVFQEPLLALNPIQPVGRQIAEGLRIHGAGRAAAAAKTLSLLDRVGLGQIAPEAFPHQLSGGQRQRVMIAIALACEPAVLIADEFSTALDMVTQAEILALLAQLTAESGLALMLVTHDLGLLASIAAETMVLYAGRVAETGPTSRILSNPSHPYTQGLRAATLHGGTATPGGALPTIGGQVPSPSQRPVGCAFAPRCARAAADCLPTPPPLLGPPIHQVACRHPVCAP
jgi:peptide/nickel transport system ATP-binding protein